mgnify:CR=1 FL=1
MTDRICLNIERLVKASEGFVDGGSYLHDYHAAALEYRQSAEILCISHAERKRLRAKWTNAPRRSRKRGERAREIGGAIAAGVSAITREVRGVNQASDETVQSRRATCLGCERCVDCVGGLAKCCGQLLRPKSGASCGCVIERKIRVRDGACPINKWRAEG